MDNTIRNQIDQLVLELKKTGQDFEDPVSKLIITALAHQAQKIIDEIDSIPQKITDRLCTYFLPAEKINAIPSICIVQPSVKRQTGIAPHILTNNSIFSYKLGSKQALSFSPLFANLIIPYSRLHILTPHVFKSGEKHVAVSSGKQGKVWVGMEIDNEVETFYNLSFLIKGTNGLLPERIYIGNGSIELSHTSASHMEEIAMVEPFDSQQSSHVFFELLSCWRDALLNIDDGGWVCITDRLKDRDAFKCRAYPKIFQQLLESNDLDKFENNTLWILFDFGRDYEIPDSIEIIPNAVPVVNVNLNSATLTQSTPIVKLSKNDGSYFLKVLETSSTLFNEGFNMVNDEIVIRDFDASCYDSNSLYKDVRNLYNRFVDDYYAFVGYHGLKDGELIKSLRETVNKIGKSVLTYTDDRTMFDEGVYAMRNISHTNQASTVKVTYITTFGRIGNTPKVGDLMENRRDAALEKNVNVILSGKCGEDKADADQRYELLRYYTLTHDRLYTKMDIDAFLRMQLIKEFGKDESKRIDYTISIQGTGGYPILQRGIYIDVMFRDSKNYQKAVSMALDKKFKQLITDKSCISMPIIFNLINH